MTTRPPGLNFNYPSFNIPQALKPSVQQAKRMVLQAEVIVNQAAELSCIEMIKQYLSTHVSPFIDQISAFIKKAISYFRGEQEIQEVVPVETFAYKKLDSKLVRSIAADMRSQNTNLAWECSEQKPVCYALLTTSAEIEEDTQIIRSLLERYPHVRVRVVGEDLGRVAELQKLSCEGSTLKVELVSLPAYFEAIDNGDVDHFVTYLPYLANQHQPRRLESQRQLTRDLLNLAPIAGKSSLYVAQQNLGVWRATAHGNVRVFDGVISAAEIQEMLPKAQQR